MNVLNEIAEERARQDAKWGEQNHPDGTGALWFKGQAEYAKAEYEYCKKHGAVDWQVILDEEVQEAFAESDPARLREELVQVAAVCVAWIQCIDRRTK